MSNPLTLGSTFNGSLGTFTGVDPTRFSGSGVLFEEGTTNLHTANVGYENSIANWTAFGDGAGVSATWSQSNEWAKSGTYAIKMIGQSSVLNNQTTRASAEVTGFSEGEVYTFSGSYNRLQSTLRVTLALQWRNGSGNVGSEVTVSDTASGTAAGVTEFASPQTCPAGADRYRLIWRLRFGATGVDHTFYGDNIQVEHKPYATSFVDVTLGDGYAFTGSAHASASTRAASSASVATANHLDASSGAIAFRITPTIETGLEEIWGEAGVKGAGTDHMQWGRDATKHPFVEWSSNNAAYQRLTGTETISVNTEYLFYLGWNGVLTELSIDAGTKHTGTRDVVEDDFSVGDLTLEASAGGVIVSPFATFDRPLTDTEIATLAARQGWSMSTLDSTTRRIRAQFELRPAY